MTVLLIGVGWLAGTWLVCTFMRGANPDVPTPKPAAAVVLSERAHMRRCPRRPTGVS